MFSVTFLTDAFVMFQELVDSNIPTRLHEDFNPLLQQQMYAAAWRLAHRALSPEVQMQMLGGLL